jgi:hypothetical protein
MNIAQIAAVKSVADPVGYLADRRRGMGATDADIRETARLRQAIAVAVRRRDRAGERKARREYDAYKARKEREMAATAAARKGAAIEEGKVEALSLAAELGQGDHAERRALLRLRALGSELVELADWLLRYDAAGENPRHSTLATVIRQGWPTNGTA